MPEIEFRQAIRDAIDEEMQRDPSVVLFGEDVAAAGGVFQATRGLYEKYGPERVFDTPISELALTGAAFGSAATGLRPVIEIMFGDFTPLAMDSLINQAAKYWFISNEKASAPLVVRSAVGAGGGFAAIHSQIPAPWFLSVAGLKIVAPATPADAKGLLRSAIRDDNPVLFLEHKRLYSLKGEASRAPVALGSAAVVRPGLDVTIVTAMKGVHDALAAAAVLAERGVDAEIVDLRTLRPLDTAGILESVAKTKRLLVVEEGPRTGGWSAEVLARLTETALGQFEDAWRLTTPDLPVPYSVPLEQAFLPGAEAIVSSILTRLGERDGGGTPA
jgi:pyruvate/2-oxoglutarate/acetoin dehydrogenase E1 component